MNKTFILTIYITVQRSRDERTPSVRVAPTGGRRSPALYDVAPRRRGGGRLHPVPGTPRGTCAAAQGTED